MAYQWPLMKNTITWRDKLALISFIATSDKFTNGPRVRRFESEWSEWLGSRHSLFVSSGSTANSLLVASVKEKHGLKDGDKVLVPACTWVTNVGPIIQCGLQPIFCDINLSSYSFDLKHMRKIAKAHRDIKMIFVTHLLGFSADVEAYREIFPKALILEDVCESHGCLAPNGSRRGSDALGATFSFYFGHHMTTVEGGMVSTNDEDLLDLMRIKRSHGLARELPRAKLAEAMAAWPKVDPRFMFMTDGYNFRNTEIAAVLGSSQLKGLDRAIGIRNGNFAAFHGLLSKHEHLFHMPLASHTNSSYAFPLVAKDGAVATKLKLLLEQAGIETRPIVSGNLLMQPFLRGYRLEPGSDMNIQMAHDNGVYVGNNHLIGEREMIMMDDVLGSLGA